MENTNTNGEDNSSNTNTNTNTETNTSAETNNTENTSTNNTETNTNNNTEDKTVPYDRFKQKNDENKSLKEELELVKSQLSNFDKDKEEVETANKIKLEELANTVSTLKKDKDNMIIEGYKVEDREYIDFLLDSERGKEENKDKSLTDILDSIRETKPQLFKNSSSVGNNPTSNKSDGNTITQAEYAKIEDSNERQKLRDKGVKII